MNPLTSSQIQERNLGLLSLTINRNRLSGRNVWYVLVFIYFQLATFPSISASTNSGLYYAKYEIIIENGVFTDARLIMAPAFNEFRMEKFISTTISGKSDKNSSIDGLSSAQHNALKGLLVERGLQSVDHTAYLFNWISRGKTIMRYEGVIRYPGTILKQGYDQKDSVYFIEMKVEFSPIAFPDRWSLLYIKKKIFKSAAGFLSIFR